VLDYGCCPFFYFEEPRIVKWSGFVKESKSIRIPECKSWVVGGVVGGFFLLQMIFDLFSLYLSEIRPAIGSCFGNA
jgi:hypothetical protein